MCDRLRKCFLVGACGVLAMLFVVGAEEMPLLDHLATDIIKATMPKKQYRVEVSQTIDQTSAQTSTNNIAIQARSSTLPVQPSPAHSTYALNYVPKNGFRTEIAAQPKSTNTVSTATTPAVGARLSINIPNFLKEIQTWPTNSVTKDVLNGNACYKVSASNRDVVAVLWVDAISKCISKVVVDIRGRRFAESTFRYHFDEENGWLMTSAETSYAGDGSHVRLEYGKYDFSTR